MQACNPLKSSDRIKRNEDMFLICSRRKEGNTELREMLSQRDPVSLLIPGGRNQIHQNTGSE